MGEITPQPGIMGIAPYVGGASKVEGANRVTKLSSNENLYGPSPKAREAYAALAGELELYPSGDHTSLREAIGAVHGLDPARIICGAGSDEIIAFLCNAYAGPGDEVIRTEHGFLMYDISARAAGATPVIVPEAQRHADVDAILAEVNEDTKIVFLANPNNPTGTMIARGEVERLADTLPDTCLLVLDGAYAEYVEDERYDAGLALVEARKNVVMTRTFSKIYGLGGLRIGYGYASTEIIDVLNRVRGPFNVSSAALAAAEAAVRDTEHTAKCRAANTMWRAWMAAELAAIGIPSDPSHGNFLLAHFADEAEAIGADEWLQKGGIIARRVGSYGLPQCLRITIGDEDACRAVVKFLAEYKGATP